MDGPQPPQPPRGQPQPGTMPLQPTLAGPPPAHLVQATVAGPQVGRFAILNELGRGGMGLVLRAWDPQLQRQVALKLLDPSLATTEALARFQREATATAALRHPGIVAVHDVGKHQGRPYFVMDLVEGESFEALLRREQRLPPRRAVELVLEVTRALAHAHEQGVVHRDVKPANVLLDRAGRPRLTDFGIARAGATDLTRTGSVMGTPEYMAPEQAGDSAKRHGPPADVYALGCVLYRALAGRTPIQGESIPIFLRRLIEVRPAPLRSLDPTLDPALDAIVLRCLEKDPARRFTDAGALARELEAWLHAPVAARGRTGLLVALVAVLAAVAGGGGVALLTGVGRGDAAPTSTVAVAPPSPPPAVTSTPPAPPPLPGPARRIGTARGRLAVSRVLGEYGAKHLDTVWAVAVSRDERWLLSGSGTWDSLAPGLIQLRTLPDLEEVRAWRAHAGTVAMLEFTHDGKRALSAGRDGAVHLWDLADPERPLATLEGGFVGDLIPAAVQDQFVLVRRDGELTLVSATGDDLVVLARQTVEEGQCSRGALLPDGRVLVLARLGAVIVDFDAQRLDRIDGPSPGECATVLLPDGQRVLTAGGDNVLRLWDLARREVIEVQGRVPQGFGVRALCVLPATGDLVMGREDGSLWRLDGNTLQEVRLVRLPGTGIWDVVALRAGRFVTAMEGVGLFDAASGRVDIPVRDRMTRIEALALSRDGAHLLVGCAQGPDLATAYLFDLRTGAERTFDTRLEAIKAVGFDADGRAVVVASLGVNTPNVQVWDLDRPEPVRHISAPYTWRLSTGAVHPDGRWLLTGGEDGLSHLRDLATGQVFDLGVDGGWVTSVAFSRDGRRAVATAVAGGPLQLPATIREWRLGSTLDADVLQHPRVVPMPAGHADVITTIPNSEDVLLGFADGRLERWSLKDGEVLTRFTSHESWRVVAVATSPGGTCIASAALDGLIHVSELKTGALIDTLDLNPSADRATEVLFRDDATLLVGTSRGVVLEVAITRP